MHAITEILYQENILAMFPKIQDYYQKQIGIQVRAEILHVQRDSDDELLETHITFPYRVKDIKKLPTHLQTNKVLDSGELAEVLNTHFSEILEKNQMTLAELIHQRKHIEHIKSQYLTYSFMDDYPEASVILRYMDGYYSSLIQKTKEQIYADLSQLQESDTQEMSLLHPFTTHLEELRALLPHFSLNDLIDFQESIARLANHSVISEKYGEDIAPKLAVIAEEIQKKIHKSMMYLVNNVEYGILIDMLPSLKKQIQVKKYLPLHLPQADPKFSELLETTIRESLLTLLQACSHEIEASVSDFQKDKKRKLIAKLIDLCADPKASDKLYQEIIEQGDLLKSLPIGRYIYESICWLLNIKISSERHSVTLFQAVNPKSIPTSEANHQNKEKKL